MSIYSTFVKYYGTKMNNMIFYPLGVSRLVEAILHKACQVCAEQFTFQTFRQHYKSIQYIY